MAAGVARGSSRCEKAVRGLLVPLGTSSHRGCRISTLAGRGARVGVKTEVTWGWGAVWVAWKQPKDASPTPTPPSPVRLSQLGSPLQLFGPRCSSCSLVSDLLREQRRCCLSSDWGQGRLVGPVLAPPWPRGQPGTHHFHWHHTALGPGPRPLHPLPRGKGLIRPGRQRRGTEVPASGPGSSREARAEPDPPGALPHTKPGPGMNIPVAGCAQCPQPEEQGKAP